MNFAFTQNLHKTILDNFNNVIEQGILYLLELITDIGLDGMIDMVKVSSIKRIY